MDYQDAIGIFENEIKKLNTRPIHVNHIGDAEKADDAMKTAISAMQELQMYKDSKLVLIPDAVHKKQCEELDKYKQIGTLEEVQEAVKKQKAKRPTYDGDGYAPDGTFVWDEWECPCCGTRYEVDYDDYYYCPNCGQHIDWTEVE